MTNFSTIDIPARDGPFVPFLRRFPLRVRHLRDEGADISVCSMLHIETRFSVPKYRLILNYVVYYVCFTDARIAVGGFRTLNLLRAKCLT